MASVDLIPNDYRHWMWQLAWLRRSAIGVSLFLVVAVAAYTMLTMQSERYQQRLMELQAQQAVSQQQQQSLESLSSQNLELQRQWNLLTGLRGGLSITDILLDIDKALSKEQVWFVDWQFKRAGEVVSTSEEGAEAAYFIMVKNSDSPSAIPERWRINSHIKVKGEAIDHVAFSNFVQRLLQRPSVADVRVVNTQIQGVSDLNQVIGFEVAILIDNRRGNNDA